MTLLGRLCVVCAVSLAMAPVTATAKKRKKKKKKGGGDTAQVQRDADDGGRPPSPSQKFGKKARGWGLGASLGDVTGASIKKFLHPAHALQLNIGWGPLHNGDGIASFEYLWHSKPQGESPIVDVLLMAGLGIGVGFWARENAALSIHGRDATAGVGMLIRAPVLGLAFHWLEHPIDTAIELSWSPYVIAVGGTELRHGDASIKVRYFF